MKKNFSKLTSGFYITAAVASLTLGCGKTADSGATASLVMTGSSSVASVARSIWNKIFLPTAMASTPPALTDKSGATVLINSAWVVIKEIEFKATETAETSESAETSLTGPYYVNLVSPSAAILGEVTAPEYAIRRIKFKFHKVDTTAPDNVPTALNGHSILIEGSVGGTPFTYLADDSTEVQVGGPHGVRATAGSSLLIAVQISDLIKKIDLSGISVATTISASNRVPGGNLCPSIDLSASDLYTCFRKGLETEAKLGRDDDGSHEIEADEEEVDDAS